jgi:hypothetical protein
MAQLNSALAASLDKLLQKESCNHRESTSKLYLRDAAMSRMTYILKNSTEKIGVVGLNYNVPKQSDSEMSHDERSIIKQWATGKHCIVLSSVIHEVNFNTHHTTSSTSHDLTHVV